MSRLRTDFYNDPPVEDEVAKADKDVLALDFVGNTESRASNHFSEFATPAFGIRLAEKTQGGLHTAAGICRFFSNPTPYLQSAGHPI